MKRVGHMMYVKNGKSKERKCNCCKCGKELTPAQAFYYVDGCNFAITQSAKAHCIDCIDKKGEQQ